MAKRQRSLMLEQQILFIENHTCAICRDPNKDVQIHHIDGNPHNNVLDNVIVLCLDCHSKVTGNRGLGKSFSQGEVRRYKRSWEKTVQELRAVRPTPADTTKNLLPQIDMLICEVPALPPSSQRIATIFSLIYELHLWRGDSLLNARILDGFGHLAIMCGLSQEGIAALHLAETTWQLCWHFVGPDDVPMDSKDTKLVIEAVEVLDTLAHFTCEFTTRHDVVQKTCDSLENFLGIGVSYSDKDIVHRVISAYDKAVNACKENDEDLSAGMKILRNSLKRISEMLIDGHFDDAKSVEAVTGLIERASQIKTPS
jgi:hypothetical protein